MFHTTIPKPDLRIDFKLRAQHILLVPTLFVSGSFVQFSYLYKTSDNGAMCPAEKSELRYAHTRYEAYLIPGWNASPW